MMLLIFMIQGRDSATGTARRSAATPAAATATWVWPPGASPSSAPASGQRRPRCCSSRPRTSSGGNLLRRRRSVLFTIHVVPQVTRVPVQQNGATLRGPRTERSAGRGCWQAQLHHLLPVQHPRQQLPGDGGAGDLDHDDLRVPVTRTAPAPRPPPSPGPAPAGCWRWGTGAWCSRTSRPRISAPSSTPPASAGWSPGGSGTVKVKTRRLIHQHQQF